MRHQSHVMENVYSTLNKKWVVLAAIAAVTLLSVRASAQTSAQVNLSVVLTNVQSISASTNAVSLNFATASDYQNGVSQTINDHLNVFSNGVFTVSVSASGDLTGTTTPSNTIPVSTISLTPSTGTSINPTASPTYSTVSLSTTSQTLIHNTRGVLVGKFNIKYSANDTNGDYLKPGDTYTTTITYTIAAS